MIKQALESVIGILEKGVGKHDRASKLEELAKQGGNLGPATSPTAFGGVDVSMFGTGTGDRARAGYSYDRAVADANKNISMYANMAMFNTYIQSSPNDVLIEAGQIGGGTSTNKESDEKYNPINTLYLGE